ncbi:hypothetical protein BDV98DRAFT_225571 [Pterulicium gracile]|uniref:Uncharacterized protein n=1 Tax=Pterulicium gracile TaxID=1884261 RepID=A0A5C3QXS2_9AGAR|nr:hypothetical protein BDV98DRAFT_225571 [Pterula gracilis]
MIPTLEALSMEFQRVDPDSPEDSPELDILLSLLEFQGPDELCPNLFNLSLRRVSFSDQSADLFMKLLTSRSMFAREEHTTRMQSTLGELIHLISGNAVSSSNAKKARSALREIDQTSQNTRSLKALLRFVAITFEEMTMGQCFSEAQQERTKALTANMHFIAR